MRTKILLTNILLALALPLAPTGARADSETGAANITIGSTAVFSGTAGLLYGDGALVRSLAGTVTTGSGTSGTSLALGNNVQLALTTDGNVSGSPLTLTSTAANGTGTANTPLMAIYNWENGNQQLVTYINDAGFVFNLMSYVISGHVSSGSNPGGMSGPGYSILPGAQHTPSMIDVWADVAVGISCRTNVGSVGEFCLMGQDNNGVVKILLDTNNSQIAFSNQTLTTWNQTVVGDAFIGRAAAANIRFGGADAASPIAQTISFQNVLAGTSNTAGVNTIFQASAGTGTGAGGSFLFQTALPGSSGTAQNAFTTALTIDGASGVTVSGILNAGGSIIGKTRTVSTATDTISASTDYFLCVTYTSTGAVTETLPAGVAGQTFLIKDCGGAAATHPITITPASGTIDGGASYSLAANYGSVAVTYVNSQWSVN